MRLVITFLIALAAASNCVAAEAPHAKYMRVHSEWVRLNELPDTKATLIVDPREHAMWIEDRGRLHGGFAVDLPKGLRWYAFHITQNGVVERSFPVRLTNTRPDIEDEAKEEQLFVVGVGKTKSQQFSFSASRSGTGFGVGSGSVIGDATFHLPSASGGEELAKYKSFLARQSPRILKPKEVIKKDGFSIRVKRRSTPPNTD